jgi:hypothetical protein
MFEKRDSFDKRDIKFQTTLISNRSNFQNSDGNFK